MFNSKQGILKDRGATATFNLAGMGVERLTENQSAQIQLLQFQACHSFYNITEENNYLEFQTEMIGHPIKTDIITIAVGNYDVSTLIAAINTSILNTCIPFYADAVDTHYPSGYEKISFNQLTGKVFFSLHDLNLINQYVDEVNYLIYKSFKVV